MSSDRLAELVPGVQRVFWDIIAFVVQLVSPVVATIRKVTSQIASYIFNIPGKIINFVAIVALAILRVALIVAAVIILVNLLIVCVRWLGQRERRAPILPVHRENRTAAYSHRQTHISARSGVNRELERRAAQVVVPLPAPPALRVKAHPSQKSSYGATHRDPSTVAPLQHFATAANRASTDLARPKATGRTSEGVYEPDANETDRSSDAQYASLRARANAAWEAMERALDECRAQRSAGNRARAKVLSDLGKVKKAEMERLNDEASQFIFRQNNTASKPGEIDLHGLYVKEAVRYAGQSIEEARRRGDSEIRLIVGKGLHSPNGVVKLKPAIEQFTKKQNLLAVPDPGNVGVLVVQLNEQAGRRGILFGREESPEII